MSNKVKKNKSKERVTKYRERLLKESIQNAFPSLTPCFRCNEENSVCLVMSEDSDACTKCLARGVVCVGLSWASLDRVRKTKQKEIAEATTEMHQLSDRLREVSAKLIRLQKELELANERAKAKAVCLQERIMEADNERREAGLPIDDPLPMDYSFLDEIPMDFSAALLGSVDGTVESSGRNEGV